MRSKDVTPGLAVREQAGQAAQVAAQVAREQAAQAAVLARTAAEKAAPKVGAAVDWASPRIEKGLLAAGPAVEAAAEKVAPAVDAARDRLIEDLLPRLVEAVNAAAVAGATAQRAAAEKVSTSLEHAASAVSPAPPAPASHRGRRLLLFGTLAAAGAAGLAAWRRSRSTAPQWDALDADEPAFTGGPEPTPSTLSEPATPSPSLASTVTEEPLESPAPEPQATGDPVLDGLGTVEAGGGDLGGPPAEAVAEPAVEVVEGDAADSDPLSSGEVGGEATGRPNARRRKA